MPLTAYPVTGCIGSLVVLTDLPAAMTTNTPGPYQYGTDLFVLGYTTWFDGFHAKLGVWKSTDAGHTWTQTGTTKNVGDDPANWGSSPSFETRAFDCCRHPDPAKPYIYVSYVLPAAGELIIHVARYDMSAGDWDEDVNGGFASRAIYGWFIEVDGNATKCVILSGFDHGSGPLVQAFDVGLAGDALTGFGTAKTISNQTLFTYQYYPLRLVRGDPATGAVHAFVKEEGRSGFTGPSNPIYSCNAASASPALALLYTPPDNYFESIPIRFAAATRVHAGVWQIMLTFQLTDVSTTPFTTYYYYAIGDSATPMTMTVSSLWSGGNEESVAQPVAVSTKFQVYENSFVSTNHYAILRRTYDDAGSTLPAGGTNIYAATPYMFGIGGAPVSGGAGLLIGFHADFFDSVLTDCNYLSDAAPEQFIIGDKGIPTDELFGDGTGVRGGSPDSCMPVPGGLPLPQAGCGPGDPTIPDTSAQCGLYRVF
jgi:hypothetical protein